MLTSQSYWDVPPKNIFLLKMVPEKISVDQIKIASTFYDVSVDYAVGITEKRKWHEESSL